MKNLSSLLKRISAAFAIAFACCGFVLFALPTLKIGAFFITLSLFFSFLWYAISLGDDISEVKPLKKAKQLTTTNKQSN